LENEPQRSGAIAQLLGSTSEEARPLRDAWIKKGMRGPALGWAAVSAMTVVGTLASF